MAAPNWTPARVTLGTLKPWQENPRLMKKAQAKRLLDGWEALGQFQTIAVGPAGEVYDGHQRLSALISVHGAKYEVAAMQSDRPLTDEERRRLVFAANEPAGQWDADKLASWDTAQVLEWAGVDAPAWADQKREVAMWGEMLAASEAEAGDGDAAPQTDRAEELREKWQTERGQLWAIGPHRLLCGDSTDAGDVGRVMGGEKAGACITDPPYGLGDDKSFNDDRPDYEDGEPFDLTLLDLSMPFVVWGGNYYSALPMERNKIGWVVWDKRPNLEGEKRESADRIFGQHFEIAVTNIGALRGKMLRHRWGGFYGSEEIHHKTQKSLALITDCVAASEGVVIDYFAGSGTTLVACQNLGRVCRAIEISEAYTAVILQRMSDAFPDLDIHRIDE
jgi:DNA modification methylase